MSKLDLNHIVTYKSYINVYLNAIGIQTFITFVILWPINLNFLHYHQVVKLKWNIFLCKMSITHCKLRNQFCISVTNYVFYLVIIDDNYSLLFYQKHIIFLNKLMEEICERSKLQLYVINFHRHAISQHQTPIFFWFKKWLVMKYCLKKEYVQICDFLVRRLIITCKMI